MIKMAASEAKNNFGLLMDKAIIGPIVINKYNRPYVVLISKDYYDYLKKCEDHYTTPDTMSEGIIKHFQD